MKNRSDLQQSRKNRRCSHTSGLQSNLSMLKISPELIVHKGNVFYLFYLAGGLLMTVTAGGQCVDAALRTAQNPVNLLRLSNALTRLILRNSKHCQSSSAVTQQLKKLYFTESLSCLLDRRRTSLQDTCAFDLLWRCFHSPESNPGSTPTNWISEQRGWIYYVLLCGGSRKSVLMLCIKGSGLKTNTYSSPLQWLIHFNTKLHTQGDVAFLLLGREPKQIRSESAVNDAANERGPSRLTLALSVLSAVLLWILLPKLAFCAVICLLWKACKQFC